MSSSTWSEENLLGRLAQVILRARCRSCHLPMWPSGLSTRSPSAVKRGVLSGRGSNLSSGVSGKNVTVWPTTRQWTHQLDRFGKQHFEQDVDRPEHTSGNGLKEPMNDVQWRQPINAHLSTAQVRPQRSQIKQSQNQTLTKSVVRHKVYSVAREINNDEMQHKKEMCMLSKLFSGVTARMAEYSEKELLASVKQVLTPDTVSVTWTMMASKHWVKNNTECKLRWWTRFIT